MNDGLSEENHSLGSPLLRVSSLTESLFCTDLQALKNKQLSRNSKEPNIKALWQEADMHVTDPAEEFKELWVSLHLLPGQAWKPSEHSAGKWHHLCPPQCPLGGR